MKNIETLIKLKQENPELDIVPMVDNEVCAGDDFSNWMGSWGSAEIDYIHIPDWNDDNRILNPERIYFKSADEDNIKDRLFDHLEAMNPAWSDEYIEENIEKKYREIDWEKVIVVKIGLP
ncbi:hypothetical protein [Oceanobacillus sp. FSL H7-0719]|uniref:hypothetical protein n=1 Tax=Oceanobacillus sp. FSL H7-0719 TaxID=2954507 RepID=UPI0032528075